MMLRTLSCIMWQSGLAACGHVGVATQASGVLFMLWNANRKPYQSFRMAPFSLSDLVKGTPIFDVEFVSNGPR